MSCDVYRGRWYVTTMSIGPIHENSLGCAHDVEFRPQLFDLKHLKSLSFYSCFTSSRHHPISVPDNGWDKLSDTLESLEFRSNPGLIGQIPTTFGYLVKLQSLVLLDNGLTGNIPTKISNLSNLKRVVISGNRFTGRIPDIFNDKKEMLILDLSRNKLSGSLPLTIGDLTSLVKLDLSDNILQGELPGEMGCLKNLTLFDIRGNNFSGGLTKSLDEMYSIEEMILANNPLGGNLASLEWKKLSKLVILDLSSTGLVGQIPESMVELKRLRFLGLSDNKLTGNVSPNLATMPNINALYLNRNNFTGELEFSHLFYLRLGRRFVAWSNPNLCYKFDDLLRNHIPYGLKPCQGDVTLVQPSSETKLGGGDLCPDSNLVSLGSTSDRVGGLFCLVLWMVVVVLSI